MWKKLDKERHTTYGIYCIVKESLNKSLSRSGLSCGALTFSKIVNEYFRVVMDRLIYRFQKVNLLNQFGSWCVYKSDNYNKKRGIEWIKIHGAHNYFIHWEKPKTIARKGVYVWFDIDIVDKIAKQVENGFDYPLFDGEYIRTYKYIQ